MAGLVMSQKNEKTTVFYTEEYEKTRRKDCPSKAALDMFYMGFFLFLVLWFGGLCNRDQSFLLPIAV